MFSVLAASLLALSVPLADARPVRVPGVVAVDRSHVGTVEEELLAQARALHNVAIAGAQLPLAPTPRVVCNQTAPHRFPTNVPELPQASGTTWPFRFVALSVSICVCARRAGMLQPSLERHSFFPQATASSALRLHLQLLSVFSLHHELLLQHSWKLDT